MKKRWISAVLAGALLLTAVPVSHAATTNDITNHWAQKYITYLHDEGVINPNTSGKYTPDLAISRAEFMRYVNRAFHFTETAKIGFSDVPSSAWYYQTVQIAVKYGYIQGVGANKMNPTSTLTREQAATIIGRLQKYVPTDAGSNLKFSDKSKISSWSIVYIDDATKHGYLVGYPDGTFRPQKIVTRAEIAKILYEYMGTSLSTKNKAYTGAVLRSDTENVTISEPCSFSDATVKGNLYVTEGVLDGAVSLSNVTVNGALVISGGNVNLKNVSADELYVSTPIGRLLKVTASGNTTVSKTQVQSSAELLESSLANSTGGFMDMTVVGANKVALSLQAALQTLETDSPATVSLSSDSLIGLFTAGSATAVTGEGTIQQARIYAADCSFEKSPGTYDLGNGLTVTIAGEEHASDVVFSLSPIEVTIKKGDAKMSDFYDFMFSFTPGEIQAVTCNNAFLTAKTDYEAIEGGIRINKAYLQKLPAGDNVVTMRFANGIVSAFTVHVVA